MSDSTADDTQEAGGGRFGRLKQRRTMILIGAGLSVVALAAGGWMGLSRSTPSDAGGHGAVAEAGHGGDHAGDAAPGEATQALLTFKDIVVNITGSNAEDTPTSRVLDIGLAMVYSDPEKNKALMEKKQPYLRDAILSYLRQLHEADLRGSDGLFLLKAELLKRARAVVGNDAPKEFLIVGLVMQ